VPIVSFGRGVEAPAAAGAWPCGEVQGRRSFRRLHAWPCGVEMPAVPCAASVPVARAGAARASVWKMRPRPHQAPGRRRHHHHRAPARDAHAHLSDPHPSQLVFHGESNGEGPPPPYLLGPFPAKRSAYKQALELPFCTGFRQTMAEARGPPSTRTCVHAACQLKLMVLFEKMGCSIARRFPVVVAGATRVYAVRASPSTRFRGAFFLRCSALEGSASGRGSGHHRFPSSNPIHSDN
jgi:hypothetical protein